MHFDYRIASMHNERAPEQIDAAKETAGSKAERSVSYTGEYLRDRNQPFVKSCSGELTDDTSILEIASERKVQSWAESVHSHI